MAKIVKKEFNFSFAHLVRWLIFAVLVYLAINYLDQHSVKLPFDLNSASSVLGSQDVAAVVPVDLNQAVTKLQNQALQFINDQSKIIQKEIINHFYQQIINGIEHQQS